MTEERESDRYIKEKWYKNIWYHYKIPIIIVLFLSVTISMFIYSSTTKEQNDLYIIYVTENPEVYTEKIDALCSTVAKYAEDTNGDGKVIVFFDNIYIGADNQDDVIYKNKEKIMTVLRSGNCMFLACDEYGLNYLTEADAFYDLSEMTDNTTEDGKAYIVNGTSFMDKDTMVKWNSDLYFGLRIYEGTIAELLPNSQQNFEKSKAVLERIINDTEIN